MSNDLPSPPAAVLFDLDGLLVDSEPAWGVAERAVVQAAGRPWDPAIQSLLLGRGPDEAAALLAGRLGDGHDPSVVAGALFDAALEAFAAGVTTMPGARELVDALGDQLPLGVVTNSRRRLADLALRSAGLDGLFDVVVVAEDVDRPKPDADPYLRACRSLGVAPERTVALEDSPVGVRAAKAAGLWVIACPASSHHDVGEADVVVGSLTEIDPLALRKGAADGLVG